jgi:hypothetical protein
MIRYRNCWDKQNGREFNLEGRFSAVALILERIVQELRLYQNEFRKQGLGND